MFRRLICILLTISMQLCALSVLTYATSDASNSDISTCDVCFPVYFGHEYSTRTFSSLLEAKQTFGFDFTYTPCVEYHQGSYYNYCYALGSGEKVFFYVELDDDIDPWSMPDHSSEGESS